MAKTKSVKVIFLGGVGEIGKNMYALEYGDDMIIMDCGMAFPDENEPGVDAVIPDMEYIKNNAHKLRGVVLTHGHEDHIGGVPFLLQIVNAPIYGSAFTLGILGRKLREHKLTPKTYTVDDGDVVTLGCFKVEFIKVCHSMAGAFAFSVETPIGHVFHTGDFKLDSTPIDHKLTNLQRIAEIGAKGVLLMLGESTNVERRGHSVSERMVGENLERIFMEYQDKRMVIATFASSNYRVQQILRLAVKYGRKVCLIGRSMCEIVEVAKRVGELTDIPDSVFVENISNIPREKQLIIATGTQGEPLSALSRLSEHGVNKVEIGKDDVVVFSSSPIPGNEKSIYKVINNLFKKGANVIYDAMSDVHVSGHAYEEELKVMLSLVRPHFFIPIHGEYRHLKKHCNLAALMGIPEANMRIAENGNVIGVSKKGLVLQQNVPCGRVYVDGEVIERGADLVGERNQLAESGIVLLLATYDVEKGALVSTPEVITKGFKASPEMIALLQSEAMRSVVGVDVTDKDDMKEVVAAIKRALRKLLRKDMQFPFIIPFVVKV